MKKFILIVLVLSLALGVVACSSSLSNSTVSSKSQITQTNYDKINEGMTFDEVKEILGDSYSLSSSTGRLSVYKWETSSIIILISIDTASNTVDAKTASF